MKCLICRELERAYNVGLGEYIEARSSACYRFTKRFAAAKNVDLERARYELEEHRHLCAPVCKVLTLPGKRDMPLRLERPAA
jgi:hypothetical protein